MGTVTRRGMLKLIAAVPFVGRGLATLAPAAPHAVTGYAGLNIAAASSMLKDLYGGQIVDMVAPDNLLLMRLLEPERYREYMLPANQCRRKIEYRAANPVSTGYAAWADAALAPLPAVGV